MRKVCLMIAIFTVLAGMLGAQRFMGFRFYDFSPPPYELSIWGTGGFMLGEFTPSSTSPAEYAPLSVDNLRTSWGFDFIFRFWVLGLGLEYSNQTMETINLDPSGILDIPANYTLDKSYVSRNAEALQLKAKLELYNVLAEAGIGFYMPKTAMYQHLTYADDEGSRKEVWTKTSQKAIDPSMIISFGAGWPLILTSSMDLIPYIRFNLFTAESAISIGNLRNLFEYKSASTIDLGFKIRGAFH
jgi:hypothetical protein